MVHNLKASYPHFKVIGTELAKLFSEINNADVAI